eukprot:2305156-Pleurochrysis_carterae.AAC.1
MAAVQGRGLGTREAGRGGEEWRLCKDGGWGRGRQDGAASKRRTRNVEEFGVELRSLNAQVCEPEGRGRSGDEKRVQMNALRVQMNARSENSLHTKVG